MQMDASSSVSLGSQDGLAAGTLTSYTIDSSGVITGTFSNGMTQDLAQLAVAGFENPSGLTSVGNNLLSASGDSGLAVVGQAGTGNLGGIEDGELETSNVDLSTEFSNMIVAERGFQANSKIITTSDSMLQNLMQAIQ
jgi:flagellar hook protein FlgE